jgi:probable phosphoglycerate mutase
VATVASDRGPAVRLVLVRHGEAVCNVGGVVGGRRGCTGLTERGVAQAEALRDRLRRTGELGPVDLLVASSLARARETARIVAPGLGAADRPALEVAYDPGLDELRPGLADGLTWAEFAERYPEPDWDADPGTPLAPEAESWTGFVARAGEALVRLATAPAADARGSSARTVVAVCHAGVIEASLLHRLPVGGRHRLGLRTRHASLTEWSIEDGAWRLERYNDATPVGPEPTPFG